MGNSLHAMRSDSAFRVGISRNDTTCKISTTTTVTTVASWADCPSLTSVIDVDNCEPRQVKIVILGPADSGKSTIFKRLRISKEPHFLQSEALTYKEIILHQIIQLLQLLLNQLKGGQHSPQWSPIERQLYQLGPYPDVFDVQGDVSTQVQHVVLGLAYDPLLKNTLFKNKSLLPDSAQYFFNSIPRIFSHGYIPNEQDILFARVKTIGIAETNFYDQSFRLMYTIWDVSGQRSERKKWEKCLQQCDIVMFVAAISEFDQVLDEDPSVSKLLECFRLWELIINSPLLCSTKVILFLNKTDMFKRKLRTLRFEDYVPHFRGKNSFKDTSRYLLSQFDHRCEDPSRVVFAHFTQATNLKERDLTRDIEKSVTESLIMSELL